MLHQHDHALDTGHQIHRAAHALDHLARNHPVGQVTAGGDLHGTQNRQVDLAAANHGKRLVRAKNRRTRQGGHGLLARVDQVGINLLFGGKRANAQHAVFRLQPHLFIARVVGHQGRNADA